MQYLGAYKWRISRLVNPLLTAFFLRAETPRLFGAIRALLDDSRLTFRRWGDCSVFPLMRSGDREKGYESPCDSPWWRAPAPLLPNLLAVVSVSSLNPAGTSSSSYVSSLPTTQDPRCAGVRQTRGRKRATCGISALFVSFSSSNSFAKVEKLKRYFLWEPLVCLGVRCKYNF